MGRGEESRPKGVLAHDQLLRNMYLEVRACMSNLFWLVAFKHLSTYLFARSAISSLFKMDIAATFTKLVRYSEGDQIYYGDLLESTAGEYTVARLSKSPSGSFTRTGKEEVVEKVSVLWPPAGPLPNIKSTATLSTRGDPNHPMRWPELSQTCHGSEGKSP